MATRTLNAQSEHDAIIAAIAGIYQRNGFEVWTNPGSSQNQRFNGMYPDVIVKLKNQNSYYILEVETGDSVNDSEVQQWTTYRTLFNFTLVVPAQALATAETLVSTHGAPMMRFATYVLNMGGTATFSSLP
ncbi:MAG TPA: hypothetical protein VMX94_00470 [Armatimonadota bacterium]|nr:hypothetical protein [Armatimonadota bacterium]